MPRSLPIALLAAASLAAQDLSLESAIRAAWAKNPALQAGAAQAEAAAEEAQAATALGLPQLSVQAGWTRTDEPMMAFGLKLNQARIGASDFDPAALNHPRAVSGLGGSLGLQQPLYAGGRIQAARRGMESMARAEAARQEFRRQEMAAAVARAYFDTQAAAAGALHAQSAKAAAEAAESFVAARVEAGLALRADLARLRAWRAQTEAALAEAQRQEASARSALALLMGGPAGALATPLESEAAKAGSAATRIRHDLQAARLLREAAAHQADAAEGLLKPEVGLNLAWGAARENLSGAGGSWSTASLGAKWSFSFGTPRKVQAARAQARAAALGAEWQQAQAAREVQEAQSAIHAAEAKVRAADEGLQAATEARELRQARHREGLLPLTDLLDAETALQGARALRLAALLDLRLARVAADLAAGAPVEGVAP